MSITQKEYDYILSLANDAVRKVKKEGYEEGYIACYDFHRNIIEQYSAKKKAHENGGACTCQYKENKP